MHTIIHVNVIIFKGEWNGIVLFLSNLLFLTAAVYFGIERSANKKTTRNT